MNFREGNLLQAELIRRLDPGHHNGARAEFLDMQGHVVRRAMDLLEATGCPLVVCDDTLSLLTWILGEQCERDPRDIMREIIEGNERAA